MTTIPIKVVCYFGDGAVRPLNFSLNTSCIEISGICAKWTWREGSFPVFYWSVVSGKGDEYEICFSTQKLAWYLRVPEIHSTEL